MLYALERPTYHFDKFLVPKSDGQFDEEPEFPKHEARVYHEAPQLSVNWLINTVRLAVGAEWSLAAAAAAGDRVRGNDSYHVRTMFCIEFLPPPAFSSPTSFTKNS